MHKYQITSIYSTQKSFSISKQDKIMLTKSENNFLQYDKELVQHTLRPQLLLLTKSFKDQTIIDKICFCSRPVSLTTENDGC